MIIANRDYLNPPTRDRFGPGLRNLVNPVNDAERLGKLLGDGGYKVTRAIDQSRDQLLASVRDFVGAATRDAALRGLRPDLVVYLAGHGVSIQSQSDGPVPNLYLPKARYATVSDVRRHGVSEADLLTVLAGADYRSLVVILDACRQPTAEVFPPGEPMVAAFAPSDPPPHGLLFYTTMMFGGARDNTGGSARGSGNGLFIQAMQPYLSPGHSWVDTLSWTKAAMVKIASDQVPELRMAQDFETNRPILSAAATGADEVSGGDRIPDNALRIDPCSLQPTGELCPVTRIDFRQFVPPGNAASRLTAVRSRGLGDVSRVGDWTWTYTPRPDGTAGVDVVEYDVSAPGATRQGRVLMVVARQFAAVPQPPPSAWSIDTFHCDDAGPGTGLLLRKVQASLRGIAAGHPGTLVVRPPKRAPPLDRRGLPWSFSPGVEVRWSTYKEPQAEWLRSKLLLALDDVSIRLRETDTPYPNYLSVFVCGTATPTQ